MGAPPKAFTVQGRQGLQRMCQGAVGLLLEMDHQISEGLIVGRRQQHQHVMDGFQPLIRIGDFWEEPTEAVSAVLE